MKTVIIAFVFAFIVWSGGLANDAFAAGGAPKAEKPSPQQQAHRTLQRGSQTPGQHLAARIEGGHEKEEKSREKRLEKAAGECEKAVAQQLSAVDKNSHFHEAFSSLGYAYRKIGEYAHVLEAYDSRLKLAPTTPRLSSTEVKPISD